MVQQTLVRSPARRRVLPESRLTIKTSPHFQPLQVLHTDDDQPDPLDGEFNFLDQSLTETDFII